MKNWTKKKLGELIKIKHGFAFKGEFFSYAGDFILLTPGNFSEHDGLQLKGEKEKFYIGDFPKSYVLGKGDLIIAMTDLKQSAPYLGSPALIKESNLFLHNQRLGLVENIFPSKLDKKFLYYLFNFDNLRAQIRGSATGATVRHTAPERIYNCDVIIPQDIKIQQKIASILSAYDDLIEVNNKRIKILEKMAQLIYREWFVMFKFPGHEKVKIKNGVPEGWEVCVLKDFVDFERGIEPGSKNYLNEKVKGAIPFLRVGDLGSRNSEIFIEENLAKGKTINKNDIAVSMDGTVGIVKMGLEGAYSTGIRKLIIKGEAVNRTFLYYLMLTDDIQNTIKAHAQGATILHASKSIDYMKFLLPTKNILDEFSNLVNPMLNLKLNLEDINNNLRETRDLLLPKLMSGEIVV